MLYNRGNKRVSSSEKLPPISKYVQNVQNSKKKINQLDVSLQLINQYSRPKMHGKQTHKIHHIRNTKKIQSLRFRTDSVGGLDKESTKVSARRRSDFDSQNLRHKKLQTTLEDFHRNIKINKQYIQNQIKRRNQMGKKQSKQNSENLIRQIKQKSRSKQRLSSKSRQRQVQKSIQKKRIRRVATQESAIFQQIEQIICGKIPRNQFQKQKQKQKQLLKLDLHNVRNLIKMTKITKNLRNSSPNQSVGQLKRSIQQQTNNSSSRMVLKDQKNYHEWRRVDLKSSQKSPQYKQSNFEMQNERLKQFVLKNQISLLQYFQFKNELYNCQSTKMKTQQH